MKKAMIVFGLILFLAAPQAIAGFVTGTVVGSMMNGGKPATPTGALLSSDKHDIVTCRKVSAGNCLNRDRVLTIYQYAALSGYKKVHRVSMYVSGVYEYYVLEVSK